VPDDASNRTTNRRACGASNGSAYDRFVASLFKTLASASLIRLSSRSLPLRSFVWASSSPLVWLDDAGNLRPGGVL
jgi:hypothetical protein